MAKELVQNPDFGTKPGEPTHIWVEQSRTPGWSPPVTGAGNAAGALIAPFLLALLTLFFYPLMSVPVLATWYGMERVADRAIGRANYWSYVAVIAVPTLAVFCVMMRAEQRLGEWRPYRWTRHVVRLLVVGVMFDLGGRTAMNLPKDPTVGRFVSDTFSNGQLLGFTVGAMVVTHLFFWLATGMRSTWHRWLRVLRLRSSKLRD